MLPWLIGAGIAGGAAYFLGRQKCDDDTLSPVECRAVSRALRKEKSPGALQKFAALMMPDHPRSAAALKTRALKLSGTPVASMGWDLGPISMPGFLPNPADAVNAIASLPPLQWVGEQLQDFSKTDFGQVVERAIASSVSQGLVWAGEAADVAWAPFFGALSVMAFALPGIMRGERLDDAFVKEMTWRIKTTIDILTAGQGGQAVGAQASQLLNQFSGQIKTAADAVASTLKSAGLDPNNVTQLASEAGKAALAKLDATPQSLQAFANRLGIREDMAQHAIDMFRGVLSQGKQFDPKSGTWINPWANMAVPLFTGPQAAALKRAQAVGMGSLQGMNAIANYYTKKAANSPTVLAVPIFARAAAIPGVAAQLIAKASDDEIRSVLGIVKTSSGYVDERSTAYQAAVQRAMRAGYPLTAIGTGATQLVSKYLAAAMQTPTVKTLPPVLKATAPAVANGLATTALKNASDAQIKVDLGMVRRPAPPKVTAQSSKGDIAKAAADARAAWVAYYANL